MGINSMNERVHQKERNEKIEDEKYLKDLQASFQQFGVYSVYRDPDMAHIGIRSQLSVFVGKTLKNRGGFYVFMNRRKGKKDVGTGGKTGAGESIGIDMETDDGKRIASNWDEGKIRAIKEAVENHCVGITDINGNILPEYIWKLNKPVEEVLECERQTVARINELRGMLENKYSA